MLTRMLVALALVMGMTLGPATPARADSWPKQLGQDFRKSWQTTRGKGVTVALLSTGVDAKVGTLRGAVTTGPDYVKSGTPKRVSGTVLASFIAGSGPSASSPFGVRGLAPAARILSVRAFPDRGEPGFDRFYRSRTWDGTLAKGIRYAADKGAKVIVVHETGWGSTKLEEAVNYAIAKNVVVVAAVTPISGGGAGISEPARFSGVIGVGSIGTNGKRSKKYSAANPAVHVSGPGGRVPTTGPGNRPYVMWGGHVAVAFVAAAAALIKAEFPDLRPAAVAQAMAKSARRQPKGGYDKNTGFGIINPAGALKEARGLTKTAELAKTGTVADKTHFGDRPGRVAAVQHDTAELGIYAGLLAFGIAACGAAIFMLRRGLRRRADVPAAPLADALLVPPGFPPPAGAWAGPPADAPIVPPADGSPPEGTSAR